MSELGEQLEEIARSELTDELRKQISTELLENFFREVQLQWYDEFRDLDMSDEEKKQHIIDMKAKVESMSRIEMLFVTRHLIEKMFLK